MLFPAVPISPPLGYCLMGPLTTLCTSELRGSRPVLSQAELILKINDPRNSKGQGDPHSLCFSSFTSQRLLGKGLSDLGGSFVGFKRQGRSHLSEHLISKSRLG